MGQVLTWYKVFKILCIFILACSLWCNGYGKHQPLCWWEDFREWRKVEGMLQQIFHPFSPNIFIDMIFLILPYFQGSEKVRDLPLPEELIFTVDEKILNDISHAKAQYFKQVDFSFFSSIIMLSFLTTIYKYLAIM